MQGGSGRAAGFIPAGRTEGINPAARLGIPHAGLRKEDYNLMTADALTLADVAHGRSGDKGNHANIAVLAYTPAGFAWLKEHLTAEVVQKYFQSLGPSRVVRYEAANLLGLNFVLYDVLAGGASRSLRTDTQGKTWPSPCCECPLPPGKLRRHDAAAAGGNRMTTHLVLYEVRPPAAVLTLNRPDRRNALSRASSPRSRTQSPAPSRTPPSAASFSPGRERRSARHGPRGVTRILDSTR